MTPNKQYMDRISRLRRGEEVMHTAIEGRIDAIVSGILGSLCVLAFAMSFLSRIGAI